MAGVADGGLGSRTQIVLDPGFVSGLADLSFEELHRRRDEALAEREFQSFLRRVVQSRADILVSERDRRLAGEEPAPLVERLTAALAGGPPQGSGRGEALRLQLPERDMLEAERRVDEVLGEASLARPESLEDEQLEATLQALERQEREVSGRRAAVIAVHDRLQEELKRRYGQELSAGAAPDS